jgi:hypothetical protein
MGRIAVSVLGGVRTLGGPLWVPFIGAATKGLPLRLELGQDPPNFSLT